MTTTTMKPADVLKLIKRARVTGPCKIGLHCEISMPTQDGMHYPYYTMVTDLTLGQATKILTEMQAFADRKTEAGQAVPSVTVHDYVSEYDHRTRFISFG